MYYSSGVVKWLFTGSDGAKCKVAQLIVQKEALFLHKPNANTALPICTEMRRTRTVSCRASLWACGCSSKASGSLAADLRGAAQKARQSQEQKRALV